MTEKFKPTARKRARQCAIQALYQWWIAGTDIVEVERQFQQYRNLAKVDTLYFHRLLTQITAHQSRIDELFIPYLDRDITTLNPIELQALRMGCYELVYEPSIPYKVAINEAVELTKIFGATDGYKYVNGVLDKVAKQCDTTDPEQSQYEQ
ncbi:MAG: transcription antitermination factor NusB [Legionellales bacterium]|nr:transcription antitermination factor NusB [Legionellales bacterium]